MVQTTQPAATQTELAIANSCFFPSRLQVSLKKKEKYIFFKETTKYTTDGRACERVYTQRRCLIVDKS